MQGNKYINFDEFKLTVKTIVLSSDFAEGSKLLEQLPFNYYDHFVNLLLEGNSLIEAFNKAVTLYHFYK